MSPGAVPREVAGVNVRIIKHGRSVATGVMRLAPEAKKDGSWYSRLPASRNTNVVRGWNWLSVENRLWIIP